MMSGSAGSTPRDWAGGPSMMMLIHRICVGPGMYKVSYSSLSRGLSSLLGENIKL